MLVGAAFHACQAAAIEKPSSTPLFRDVRIFDGTDGRLTAGMNVLAEGNTIVTIAPSIQPPQGAVVVDGGGRTLMPGLIDAHVHLHWNLPVAQMLTAPQDFLYALTLREGRATLMRGYTPSAIFLERSLASNTRSTKGSIPVRVSTPPGRASG